MHQIDIKPFSVNDAWKGRRYRTNEYKDFKQELLLLLPPKIEIPEGNLKIFLEWGFSSKGSDWDNPIKPFQDVISEKYGFNDNRIYDARTVKKIVPKGQEYIKFQIEGEA